VPGISNISSAHHLGCQIFTLLRVGRRDVGHPLVPPSPLRRAPDNPVLGYRLAFRCLTMIVSAAKIYPDKTQPEGMRTPALGRSWRRSPAGEAAKTIPQPLRAPSAGEAVGPPPFDRLHERAKHGLCFFVEASTRRAETGARVHQCPTCSRYRTRSVSTGRDNTGDSLGHRHMRADA
jgi:hypothetical protein